MELRRLDPAFTIDPILQNDPITATLARHAARNFESRPNPANSSDKKNAAGVSPAALSLHLILVQPIAREPNLSPGPWG
jgi:hypothetical protein